MVAMGLNNLRDVFTNVSMYAANEYPKLHIQLKKGEVEAERIIKNTWTWWYFGHLEISKLAFSTPFSHRWCPIIIFGQHQEVVTLMIL